MKPLVHLNTLRAHYPEIAARMADLAKKERRQAQQVVDEIVLQALTGAAGRTGLKPKQVAVMLGCTKHTVLQYLARRMFPNAVRINQRVVRIPLEDVERLMGKAA